MTGKTYSGRTSGNATPLQNVLNRDRNHKMNEEGFGPARLDKTSSNPDAIRGQEQINIKANGGAKVDGGTSGNKINGISESNSRLKEYIDAAMKEFGF